MKVSVVCITSILFLAISISCNRSADDKNGKSRKTENTCNVFLGIWVNDDNPHYPFYIQIKKKDGKFIVKDIPQSYNLNGPQTFAAICKDDDALEVSTAFPTTITYFNENGTESILSGGTTYTRYTKNKE